VHGQILQCNLAENIAYLRLYINPDRVHIAGSVSGAVSLVDDASVGDNRALNCFNYFQKGYFIGCPTEYEAPAGAAIRFDETDFTELLEYFGQKGGRHIYCGSNITQQTDLVAGTCGQVHDTTNCVLTFARKLHHNKTSDPDNRNPALTKPYSDIRLRIGSLMYKKTIYVFYRFLRGLSI
jgi:hypothetical protein